MPDITNAIAKLRFKIISLRSVIRRLYYRVQGMTIGAKTILGRIDIEWPGSLEIGCNCNIQNNTTFWIQSPFKRENRIYIGDNVFIGRNTEFNCCDYIRIGNNCLIASSTVFVDSSHTFVRNQLIAKQFSRIKGVTVDDDVWIGTGCKILLGVHLEKGCIIGAGAVVNKSVPAFEIWAGVPARKIGKREIC